MMPETRCPLCRAPFARALAQSKISAALADLMYSSILHAANDPEPETINYIIEESDLPPAPQRRRRRRRNRNQNNEDDLNEMDIIVIQNSYAQEKIENLNFSTNPTIPN
jgi:hypothetical protein